MRRLFLDVGARVAHRDRQAAVAKHRQIILHVADGGDRIGCDVKALGHRLHEGALVVARRGDVEVIALRPHRGCLRAQRLLHRGFAALQQRRIGAGADDLAGGREIRRKIRNDGRIGPDRALFIWNVFAVGSPREPELVGKQPDIDAEFVQHVETTPGRGRGDQMLLDRV